MAIKSPGDLVKVKLTQWAMGDPGFRRPPGTVFETQRHLADMLVAGGKAEIIEDPARPNPETKRVAAAPRNKSLSAGGGA